MGLFLAKRCVLVLAVCAGLTGCAGQPAGQGPGHRRQALALSPQQELVLGQKAYREVLSKSRVMPGDSPEVQRVRRVASRIAQAAGIEPLQREINLRVRGYKFEWQANVLESRQINAFCLPGGKIAVYSALLPVTQNDDQLATVLGHEVAHALAHHASERIAREQKMDQALRVVQGTLGALGPADRKHLIGLLAAGAEVNSLKYDRQQEAEADHIGLFLMTFAGYDPDQALVFWQRMEHATRGGLRPEILSDHPSDAHRIAKIKEWVPRAKGAKRAFDEGRVAPAR